MHNDEGDKREEHVNWDLCTGQIHVVYAKVHNTKCDRDAVTSDLRNLGPSILIIDLEDETQAKEYADALQQAKSEAAKEAENSKYKCVPGHGRGEDRNPELQWQFEVIVQGRFILAGREGFVTSMKKVLCMRTTDTHHDIVVFEANLKVALCNAQTVKFAVAGHLCDDVDDKGGQGGHTWLEAMDHLMKSSVRVMAGQFTTNVAELVCNTRNAGYEFHAIAVDPVLVDASKGAVGSIVSKSFMFSIGPINSIKAQTQGRTVAGDTPEAGQWMECSTIRDWPGLDKLAPSEPNDHLSYQHTRGWPAFAASKQKATTNRQIARLPPQLR